jgi:hypothetical protein
MGCIRTGAGNGTRRDEAAGSQGERGLPLSNLLQRVFAVDALGRDSRSPEKWTPRKDSMMAPSEVIHGKGDNPSPKDVHAPAQV